MTLTTTLASLKQILDRVPIRWTLIGALAANRYRGSPRMTGDVDLLLADAHGGLKSLQEKFVAAGWQIQQADPEGDLIRLTHEQLGTADLLIAGTEYQLLAIKRSTYEDLDGQQVLVLSVEDVIIHKLIAGRFQDLADIEAILSIKPVLDLAYLQHWIEIWEVEDRWQQLRTASPRDLP